MSQYISLMMAGWRAALERPTNGTPWRSNACSPFFITPEGHSCATRLMWSIKRIMIILFCSYRLLQQKYTSYESFSVFIRQLNSKYCTPAGLDRLLVCIREAYCWMFNKLKKWLSWMQINSCGCYSYAALISGYLRAVHTIMIRAAARR